MESFLPLRGPCPEIVSPRLPPVRAWALGAVCALALLTWPGVADAATTATATFSTPGQYLFAVPAGVTSVTVAAVGGAGGSCTPPPSNGGETGPGGRGASVTATVAVTTGEQLFVGVGGVGGACGDQAGAGGTGGAGGGGGAIRGRGGAGGGGASLVGVATPSPSFAGLLVVAGAGGGAGATDGCCNQFDGGDAGAAGQSIFNQGNGVGGGGATLTSGGAGSISDGSQGSQAGAAGSLGLGGAGGACSGADFPPQGGGGGGGSGYYGGGGGGCGARQGSGGGGGSSLVAPGSTNVSMALSSAAPSVAISYVAPTAEESTATMHFGTQAPGTAGPAQTLTVKNNGSAPLVVSGILLGGSDPGDFLVGDRCQQPVAPGSSCQVGVRFHPQATGARSATLTLLTNAASAPPPVALAGGVSAAARGPAGRVELLTCKPTGNRLLGHGRGVAQPRAESCTGRVVRGTVKFTATGASMRARLVRGRVIFATGASVATAHGGSELVLTQRRPLRRGTYTLILRRRHGRHWITRRLRLILR